MRQECSRKLMKVMRICKIKISGWRRFVWLLLVNDWWVTSDVEHSISLLSSETLVSWFGIWLGELFYCFDKLDSLFTCNQFDWFIIFDQLIFGCCKRGAYFVGGFSTKPYGYDFSPLIHQVAPFFFPNFFLFPNLKTIMTILDEIHAYIVEMSEGGMSGASIARIVGVK